MKKISSILVVDDNCTLFKETVDSFINQKYNNWELVIIDNCDKKDFKTLYKNFYSKNNNIIYKQIKNNKEIGKCYQKALNIVSGDYIIFLEQNSKIYDFALEDINKIIPIANSDIIYFDNDYINEEMVVIKKNYKPDFSIDLLYSNNYIGNFICVKSELVNQEMFNSNYQNVLYNLYLKLVEKKYKFKHYNRVLYSNLIKKITKEEEKKYTEEILNIMNEHLKNMGYNAIAEKTKHYNVLRIKYNNMNNSKVAIIIPMKDNYQLSNDCVMSILDKTKYSNYDVLILNNNSEKEETYGWFKSIVKKSNKIRVIDALFEFNWSKLQNLGIKNSDADVFVFLNNDTVIIDEDWIETLCTNALRDDAGVVGPLLLYDDDTIQHAGVVIGLGGYADHVFKGMNINDNSCPFVLPYAQRNVLAVTGACMAISRKTLDKIGLFNEDFIICGSDVEICLRAYENGLNNIYTPFTNLYHLESKSRDSYIPEIDFTMSEKYYGPYWQKGDPFYNSNLSLGECVPREKNIEELRLENEMKMSKNKLYNIKRMNRKIEHEIKKVLKKNKLAVKIYRKLKHIPNYVVDGTKKMGDYPLYEITPIKPRKFENDKKIRINIMVPTLYKENVFGGIATALKFFDSFTDKEIYKRIIVTETPVRKEDIVKYPEYEIVAMESHSDSKYQVVSISDRGNKTLEVTENDIFIATAWWTAYTISPVIEWQNENYKKNNSLIYFIQDYEPYFYPWSSKCVYSEYTYHLPINTIAVFNSIELKTFFNNNNYSFYKEYYFGPILNDALKEKLLTLKNVPRKKKIIVYGRPSVARNAFEIIVDSLIITFKNRNDINDWEFISVGEQHEPVIIGGNNNLKSIGKLTLEDYAKLMNEAYIGISLMISPHPSYPPLEMSTFGVKTITNCYANKDMSYFNDNIISVKNCDPMTISKELKKLCDNFNPNNEKSFNEEYINSSDQFNPIVEDIMRNLK